MNQAKTCDVWCPHVDDTYCICCDCLIIKGVREMPKDWIIVEGKLVKEKDK